MTDFKTTPDQADLAGIERDLSFHPSPGADPATLTREQVDHFNESGYVRPLTIFKEIEIAGHRAYFDRLLEQTLSDGGDSSLTFSKPPKYKAKWSTFTIIKTFKR